MTLTERLKDQKPKPRKQPEWIRRMQEGKLPNQDRTDYLKVER